MSFSRFDVALDAAVFQHLSDDLTAVWTRAGGGSYAVAAILEAGERVALQGQMRFVGAAEVVRLSAAEVSARTDGLFTPGDGDTLQVNGTTFTIHGKARLDEESGGRDWLCPVTR